MSNVSCLINTWGYNTQYVKTSVQPARKPTSCWSCAKCNATRWRGNRGLIVPEMFGNFCYSRSGWAEIFTIILGELLTGSGRILLVDNNTCGTTDASQHRQQCNLLCTTSFVIVVTWSLVCQQWPAVRAPPTPGRRTVILLSPWLALRCGRLCHLPSDVHQHWVFSRNRWKPCFDMPTTVYNMSF